VIAGDGPERAALEAQAVDLGIGGSAQFLGSVPNDRLPDLYRRAAAAVFPFRQEASGDQEGFGLVVVEAMGCGCPVIVGDVPAVRDIVGHGDRGLLTPPDDADRLHDSIRWVLAEPANAAGLGARARSFVASQFDWNSTGSAMSKIVARLAAEYPI
jgi:glycosyltransferase involved in cell wall biosynthesis